MKALWRNTVVAETDDTVVVEGNHYFPIASIKEAYFIASEHRSLCPWKGVAHYYSLQVGDEINQDAVWFYPEPREAATNIKGRVAFWRGVDIVE